MEPIRIEHAREGNLKDVTLEIPKGKLVVFTGLSGSGKSTLLIDVLFQECQRQYLEAMGMQGIRKPAADRIRNVSPAIVIPQTDSSKNPRSTVGTVTNLYTDLRMLFEKLGVRRCPHCGAHISAADCLEDTVRQGDDFLVYMTCHRCGFRMRKLTRTDFSFNTREGACPDCEGLRKRLSINRAQVLDETRAPEDGAVRFWEAKFGEYQAAAFYAALGCYGIPVPPHTSVAQMTALQKAILLDGVESQMVRDAFPDVQPPKTVAAGRFEGVFPMLWKRMADHGGDSKRLRAYFDTVVCPQCRGERLKEASRAVTVHDVRLPVLSTWPLAQLAQWVQAVRASLAPAARTLAGDYLLDLETRLRRYVRVGLGYLSLDRQTMTLSGGELQRVRLAAVLDSDLTGVIYILDEPTLGLHPSDTAGMLTVLKQLRDLGNTVLVIEHDPDVMREADYIIDIGPGAGRHGGCIIGAGTPAEIRTQPDCVTGRYISTVHPVRTQFRAPSGTAVRIRNASKFNLRQIQVDIPAGCLTTVTGPSGSGKSTLIFGLAAQGDHSGPDGTVSGCGAFDAVVEIGQAPLTRMKRSNVATYSEAYGPIRKLFAAAAAAAKLPLTAKHFSFNTPGGRCETCAGLGYVTSNLLFFREVEVPCPACGGRQFSEQVLSVSYRGHSIHDVMQLSVEEAAALFSDEKPVSRILSLLLESGLGYLTLGQPLTTLSGGEGQRLKLAKERIGSRGRRRLYLMDEPTAGLHPLDVAQFLALLHRLVDAGNTVVVVEHNAQVIQESDWIIDLGPGGGDQGGSVMFTGTPAALLRDAQSVTARCLRRE